MTYFHSNRKRTGNINEIYCCRKGKVIERNCAICFVIFLPIG